MPLKPALADRETAAGHRLGALQGGGGGVPTPLPMHPWIHTSPLFPKPPSPAPSTPRPFSLIGIFTALPTPRKFRHRKTSPSSFEKNLFSHGIFPAPNPSPGGSRGYCTSAQEAISTKRRKKNILPSARHLKEEDPQPGLLFSSGGGEGEGILDPKLGVPKMARQDFPSCKFRCFPLESLWSGERGRGFGGSPPPPPPPLVFDYSKEALLFSLLSPAGGSERERKHTSQAPLRYWFGRVDPAAQMKAGLPLGSTSPRS